MYYSKRQDRLVNELIREEAERIVNGRKLSNATLAEGFTPEVTSVIEDNAYDVGKELAIAAVESIHKRVFKIVAEELNNNSVGGPGANWSIDDVKYATELSEGVMHDEWVSLVDSIAERTKAFSKTLAERVVGHIEGQAEVTSKLMSESNSKQSKSRIEDFDQATIDMAREWVNENYPELEGHEWEEKVLETAKEIEDLHDGEDEDVNESDVDSEYDSDGNLKLYVAKIPVRESDLTELEEAASAGDVEVFHVGGMGRHVVKVQGTYDNVFNFLTDFFGMTDGEADMEIGEVDDEDQLEDPFEKERYRIKKEW